MLKVIVRRVLYSSYLVYMIGTRKYVLRQIYKKQSSVTSQQQVILPFMIRK